MVVAMPSRPEPAIRRQLVLMALVALVLAGAVVGGWFNRNFLYPDPATWQQGRLISAAYDPPVDKVGLYMGYFYLCVALGNLFGGLLSGTAYEHFGKRGTNRPDLLFVLIAGLSVGTALVLWLYDRWLRSHPVAPRP